MSGEPVTPKGWRPGALPVDIAIGVVVGLLAAVAKLPIWAVGSIGIAVAVISHLVVGGLFGDATNGGSKSGVTDEAARRQKMRSVAIALALGGMVLLFYLATIVRLGGHVMNRPM